MGGKILPKERKKRVSRVWEQPRPRHLADKLTFCSSKSSSVSSPSVGAFLLLPVPELSNEALQNTNPSFKLIDKPWNHGHKVNVLMVTTAFIP